jgi:hypothetical protein
MKGSPDGGRASLPFICGPGRVHRGNGSQLGPGQLRLAARALVASVLDPPNGSEYGSEHSSEYADNAEDYDDPREDDGHAAEYEQRICWVR